MPAGLVPSCPETGLGTSRSPSGGPAWTAPAVPADDRRGAGPARPEPRARHPDPHVAHRYPALTGRRPRPRRVPWPGSRPRRSAAPGPLTWSRHQAGAGRAWPSRDGVLALFPGELSPGASRQSRDLTAPVPVRACPALW